MKKGFLLTTVFAAGLLILSSCSKEEEEGRSMKEYVSSFLIDDDEYIAFGATDINKILNKAEYQMIPEVGSSLAEMIHGINGLNTESPLYFALKGPMDSKGNPTRSVVFLDISNQDSIVTYLSEAGYSFEDMSGIQFHSEDNLAIGIKNDLAILIYSNDKFEGKKEMSDAFVNVNRKDSNPKVAEILNDDSDIIIGTNFEAMYKVSEMYETETDAERKAELADAVEESYFQTVFKFEDGQAVIENRSKVNEKMADMLFLKNQGTTDVATHLGPGNARLALALNIDVAKIDAFLEKFAPNVKEDLIDQTGPEASMMLNMFGSDLLSKLFSGEFGVALTTTDEGSQAFIPNVNAYIGLGESGANLINEFKPGPETGLMEAANGFSSYEGNYLRIEDKSVKVITNGEARLAAGENLDGRLVLPDAAMEFGNKPFSAFIDFSSITTDEMEMAGDFEKVLNVVSFVFIEADNNVSRIVIKAKDGKENILQQILAEYLEDIMKNASKIAV